MGGSTEYLLGLINLQQRLGSEILPSLGRQFLVKGFGQLQAGQIEAHFLGRFNGDPHVLDEMFYVESRAKSPLSARGAKLDKDQLPAAPGSMLFSTVKGSNPAFPA